MYSLKVIIQAINILSICKDRLVILFKFVKITKILLVLSKISGIFLKIVWDPRSQDLAY